MVNRQRHIWFTIAALVLLIMPLVIISQASAASEDQIRQILVQRLLEKADDLERQIEEGDQVRATLLNGNEETAEKVLDEWTGRGREYANILKPLWKEDLFVVIRDHKQKLDCYYRYINAYTDENSKIIRASADGIRTAPKNRIKNILESMSTSVVAKRNLEKIGSDCGGAALQVQDKPVSLDWNSQCYPDETIENGGSALTERSVAAILYDNGRDGSKAFCSGTLIAPYVVLTAAHCFCLTASKHPRGRFYRTARSCGSGQYLRAGGRRRALDPRDHSIYLQHAGVFKIRQVIIHPRFRWTGRLPRADLALLILDRPVRDIEPIPINKIGRLRSGVFATGAGFGFYRPIRRDGFPERSSRIVEFTGLKLQGTIRTSRCSSIARRRNMICWTYRKKFRTRSLGSTCKGDSGGPLFAVHKGKKYLVGVTSAGGQRCQPGSRAYNFETFAFRRWISKNLKANKPARGSQKKGSNPRQVSCIYCPICSVNIATAQVHIDNEIRIDSATAQRMRVSVNCTPGIIDQVLGLTVVKSGNVNDVPNTGLYWLLREEKEALARANPEIGCSSSGRSAVQSCEFGVQHEQKWKVKIEGALDRDCQIMATTFDN